MSSQAILKETNLIGSNLSLADLSNTDTEQAILPQSAQFIQLDQVSCKPFR